MKRLPRHRMVLAAIAATTIAATAGCAAQAASPVPAPVVLATLGGNTRTLVTHHSKSHGAPRPKARHRPSPTATRTNPGSASSSAPTSSTPTTPAGTGTTPAASPTPSTDPTTAAPPPQSGTCTTSSTSGECGPYSDAQIEGQGSGNQNKLQIGNNIWAPVSGASQTLYASSPADWHVVANMPSGNTGVVSYPSLSVDFHLENSSGTWYEQPLTNFKSMVSSFSETMNATSSTSAWGAYDIWLNNGNNEVMIQHDFANNGACTAIATATFGGSNGVPSQPWHLCKFGSEQVWKLGENDNSKINETSGSVDVLGMLTWMENHGDLPQNSTIGLLGYGWEICSTGGKNETFQVNSFSLTT
jgi:hypothetical protein